MYTTSHACITKAHGRAGMSIDQVAHHPLYRRFQCGSSSSMISTGDRCTFDNMRRTRDAFSSFLAFHLSPQLPFPHPSLTLPLRHTHRTDLCPNMPPKGSKLGPPSAPAVDPDSPAAQQQKEFTQGISEFELPKTTLTKLAKGAVSL